MANMLEGGGRTPLLPPAALQDLGFSIVAYPLSLLGVSVRAMQHALQGLQARSAARPLSLLGASVRAMQQALQGLQARPAAPGRRS